MRGPRADDGGGRWGPATLVAALALGVGLAVGLAGAAGSGTGNAVSPAGVRFGEPVHVSAARAELPHVEPHLARDPTDPDHLLAASMLYRGSGTQARAGVYRSVDGGRSWRPVELAADGSAIDPWVEIDARGRAWLVHLPGRVHVSPDGGDSWEPPVDLPVAEGTALDFPKLIADRGQDPIPERVYVVSASSGRDPAGQLVGPIQVFRSDGAAAFQSAASILPANIDYQIAAPPVLLPDGRLLVGFSELSHAGELLPPGRIWVTRSDDGGATFAPPSLVAAEGGGNVSMAVDRSNGPFHGRLYLAFVRMADWSLRLTHSDDAGLTWSEPIRVDDASLRRLDVPTYPALAVGDQGRLGLLWADFRDDPEQRCYSIRFAHSDDGAESLSTSSPIPGTRQCPDLPGPNRWLIGDSDNAIADRFLAGGDYYGLVARPEGGFQALWADARTGVFQLWSTRVEIEPTSNPGHSTTPQPPSP